MIVIRLARKGAKKRPFYHVVVADKRRQINGRFLEKLGYLNPIATENEQVVKLNMERIKYWTALGAQPSNRVRLLIDNYQEKDA